MASHHPQLVCHSRLLQLLNTEAALVWYGNIDQEERVSWVVWWLLKRLWVRQGNSRILVDAEHTYMQPAIDALAIRLQQRCNRSQPVVINTYQARAPSNNTPLVHPARGLQIHLITQLQSPMTQHLCMDTSACAANAGAPPYLPSGI